QERLTARVQAQRLYTLRPQPPRIGTLKRDTKRPPKPMKPVTEIPIKALAIIATNHPIRARRRVLNTNLHRAPMRREQTSQLAPHPRQLARRRGLHEQRDKHIPPVIPDPTNHTAITRKPLRRRNRHRSNTQPSAAI